MIGHSFGGLALFAAVSQSLVNGFVTGEDIDGKHPPVERLGDMIVLINPAFEATRYQPLDRAARNRKYDVYQAPVFISVTSEADQATGKLFPLGRTLNTIFESELTKEERNANRNTPGHIDAYLTHRLEVEAADTQRNAPAGNPIPRRPRSWRRTSSSNSTTRRPSRTSSRKTGGRLARTASRCRESFAAASC